MLILQHKVSLSKAIPSCNHIRFIIMSEGPLRNTIVDFWRMVWENRLTAIVMLTETIEAGRVCIINS